MKYVIIGASAAGLAAAEQIRKTDPAGAVTLLTRETDLPYSRPSISYYLKGLVRRGQMRLRTPAYYKEQKIEIVTDVEVTAIDRAKKRKFRQLRKHTCPCATTAEGMGTSGLSDHSS